MYIARFTLLTRLYKTVTSGYYLWFCHYMLLWIHASNVELLRSFCCLTHSFSREETEARDSNSCGKIGVRGVPTFSVDKILNHAWPAQECHSFGIIFNIHRWTSLRIDCIKYDEKKKFCFYKMRPYRHFEIITFSFLPKMNTRVVFPL